MTLEIDNYEDAEYGDGVGLFVSKFIYTTPEVAIRELITNGKDQYLDPTTFNHENFMKIIISINKIRRTIKYDDFATGIMDRIDFKRFFSKGKPIKKVGNIVSTLESPDENMIGKYHVGKGSYLKMSRITDGDIVTFSSNNGERGDILTMALKNDKLKWNKDKEFNYPKDQAHIARKDIGLTVEIAEVVDELLDINFLEKKISRWFGIMIKRGLRIFLEDEVSHEVVKVVAPAGLDTHEDKQHIPLGNGRFITHCLKENLKPKFENIDVYVGLVYIKSIHIDYYVEGWINCNVFELNAARDGFQLGEGTQYREGNKLLLKYISDNFTKQHEREKVTGQEDMNKLLQRILEKASSIFELDPLTLIGVESGDSKLRGQVTEVGQEGQWVKKQVTIKPNTGDINNPVIICGLGPHIVDGGIVGGPTGDQTGYIENGPTTILEKSGKNPRPKTGPVKPNVIFVRSDLGDDEPMSKMVKPTEVILNTSLVGMKQILGTSLSKRLPILAQLGTDATVEYITKDSTLTITDFRRKCSRLYSDVLGLCL